jgi:hypothetical protein
MATPPNNYFAQNVFTIPNQQSNPVGAPNVITLDYFAEGITDYTLNCAQFTSYLTYVNVVGPTTGASVNLYIPSTYNLNGQTVVVKNTSADDVIITPVSGVQIDEGNYASVTLTAPPSIGDLGAVTLEANPTNTDSWYILDTFVQF